MLKIILIIIIFFITKYANSNSIFETSFHHVEFVSNNIENEKVKRINQIKIESILNIFNKSLSINESKKIVNNLTEDLTNTLIRNIIVSEEQIINDKYIAKIKVNFEKKKIINFFRENKLPYVEYLPDNFLLIIYEESIINNNLFSKKNYYYQYLKDNFEDIDLFKIPNLDINDRFILSKDDLINNNFYQISKFGKKYNTDDLVIISSKNKNNITIYKIKLYSDGKVFERKIILKKNDYKTFFKLLRKETLNAWKEINKIQNSTINFIDCKVSYFNILELKEIRKKIKNISVIETISVKSLSYKNVTYNIKYYGDLKILNNLFNINKLKIDKSDDYCKIKLI